MGYITHYSITPKLDDKIAIKKLDYTEKELEIIKMCKESGYSVPKELQRWGITSLKKIIDDIREVNGKEFCNGFDCEEIDWNTLEDDMKLVSSKVPDSLIKLLVIYDQGFREDCSLYYFKNGKMQKSEREPFDEAKLK